MDAETKQQLYGGEITDYLAKAKETTPKDDNNKMEYIYSKIRANSLKFNARDYFDNKLE